MTPRKGGFFVDKYASKLNNYLIRYKKAIAGKYLDFCTLLENHNITKEEFDTAAKKVNYFNRVAGNIKFFFQDECIDIFNYFYELSLHLLDPTFTEKDSYNILRFAIIKNYKNSLSLQNEMINLEALLKHKFKTFRPFQVQILFENGRLKELLDGTAKDITEREISFLDELAENEDEFDISIENFRIKIKTAYKCIDKFESIFDIFKLKKSLEDLGVCDECLKRVQKYLDSKLKNYQEKREKEELREIQKMKESDTMKLIEKYLLTLEDIKEFVSEEEKKETIERIEEKTKKIEFEVTGYELVNEITGKVARDELNLLITYFSKSEEECLNSNILFRNFALASEYMRSVFGVKTMDAYQLIATMVRRNHKITEHSESKLVFDLEAVKRIDFKTMTQERVLEIFKDEVTLARYVKGENLTEEEQEQRKEIGSHLDELIHDYKDYCKHNDAFYKNFVQVFPNITLENIIDGLKELKLLGVNDDLLANLKRSFISIFRANIHKSMDIFDLELNHVYLEILIEDEKEREKIEKELLAHNTLVNSKKENASKVASPKATIQTPVKIYLTEKEVRELNKYIREFYNTYHAKIVKLPNYEELLNCIEKMEELEEDFYAIARFIDLALTDIFSLKEANYLNKYDELICLIGYLIKYKIPRDKIDTLIRLYKKLKPCNSDLVEFLKDSLDEIRTYDESLAEDTEMLLSELEISSKEDYDATISLLEEIMASLGKFNLRTDYEYKLGLEKLGG